MNETRANEVRIELLDEIIEQIYAAMDKEDADHERLPTDEPFRCGLRYGGWAEQTYWINTLRTYRDELS